MLWCQDDSVEDGSMYACMFGRMDLTVVHLISLILLAKRSHFVLAKGQHETKICEGLLFSAACDKLPMLR